MRELGKRAQQVCAILLLAFATLANATPAAPAAPVATSGITSLKPMHITSVLVQNGKAACAIVAPGDKSCDDAATELQAALRESCGVSIEIIRPEASAKQPATDTLLILGNLSNNAVVAHLYEKHFCLTDGLYPGGDGYELRTIHNPEGLGRNYALLGGSTSAGVAKAVKHLATLLADDKVLLKSGNGSDIRLARILQSESVLNPSRSTLRADRARFLINGLDSGESTNLLNETMDHGLRYYLTGNKEWGLIFRDVMLHYYKLATEEGGDWFLEHKTGFTGNAYFWPWRFVYVWDNIEESDIFSDDERLKISIVLHNITRTVAELDYFDLKTRRGGAYGNRDDLRQGHATYAMLSLYMGMEYIRMYYPHIRTFDASKADIERMVFSHDFSYKTNDNAVRYSPLSQSHMLNYRMYAGNISEIKKHHLAKVADSIVMTTDNCGDAVTYGDHTPYVRGYTDGLIFLSRAAWYYNDPGWRWAFDWINARSTFDNLASGKPRYDLWYMGLYYTDGPRAEPTGLTGIVPLMLDKGLYDFVIRKFNERNSPPVKPPSLAQCFDKMPFRRNFLPQDEYMLLGGISGGLVHGHEDGNSVLRLTWDERIWLAELEYGGRAPSEHNSLMVLRDLQYTTIPPFTRLDTGADFPRLGFSRTSVPDYNGVDWARNIFWRKGAFFLFIDEVVPKEPGDYQLQLVWRGLGEVEHDGGNLLLTQQDKQFNIKNADGSRKALAVKKDNTNSDWSRYTHAGGGMKVLSQFQTISKDKPKRAVYINLLHPGAPDRFEVRRMGPASARLVSGGKTHALAGRASANDVPEGAVIEADAYFIERAGISLVNARRVSLAGLELQGDASVSLEIDWKKATGTLVVPAATTVALGSGALMLNGHRVTPDKQQSQGGKAQYKVPAGTHALQLVGAQLQPLDSLLDRPFADWNAGQADTRAAPRHAQLKHLAELRLNGPVQQLAVGDINGDRREEIIATTSDTVYCIDAEGRLAWQRKQTQPVGALQLADVDGNGVLDIIIGAGADVQLLDKDGAPRWRYECDYMKSPVTALAAADLAGDGRVAILAGNAKSVLYAIEADGTLRWKNYNDVARGHITSLLAEDFDNDGKVEILTPTSKGHGAVLIEYDGSKARWKLAGTHHIARAAVLEKGQPKLILAGGVQERGGLQFFDPVKGRAAKRVMVSDDMVDLLPFAHNAKGDMQVCALYATTGLFIINAKGEIIGRKSFGSIKSALAVGDFDGDGNVEFAVGAQDGHVWVTDAAVETKAVAELASPVLRLAAMRGKDAAMTLVAATSDGLLILLRAK